MIRDGKKPLNLTAARTLTEFRPYGNFSSYFKPPPASSCKPPPANYRLPCPRSAAHLVISAATFPQAFGEAFLAEFLDHTKPASEQHHRIYSLIRSGYEALFHLADPSDAAYLHQRLNGMTFSEPKKDGGMTIGLHVRHGDLHPWELEFENDYLPLTNYMDEVRQILIDRYEHDDDHEEAGPHMESTGHNHPPKSHSHHQVHGDFSHLSPFSNFGKPKSKIQSSGRADLLKRHSPPGFAASKVLLASDDPLVFSAPEVSRAMRAQDRIILASKADLAAAQAHGGSKGGKKAWLDTLHGWEGGFFASAFLGMGTRDGATRTPPGRSHLEGRSTVSPDHEFYAHTLAASSHGGFGVGVKKTRAPIVSKDALRMREIIGRGYLLDLAILGNSDAVVCGVSSAACRILGVMMGWDKVRTGEGWKNVDGNFGWRGMVVG
jgi:hypothetical protein